MYIIYHLHMRSAPHAEGTATQLFRRKATALEKPRRAALSKRQSCHLIYIYIYMINKTIYIYIYHMNH